MGTWFVTGGAGFIGASLIHVPPPGRAGAPGRKGGEPGLTCAGNRGNLATFAPQLDSKGRHAFHQADVTGGDVVEGIFEALRSKVVVGAVPIRHIEAPGLTWLDPAPTPIRWGDLPCRRRHLVVAAPGAAGSGEPPGAPLGERSRGPGSSRSTGAGARTGDPGGQCSSVEDARHGEGGSLAASSCAPV